MAETNVFFGTAFPQQTERDKRLGATDAGQFLPAWKQEARDEQGRRRFHGAFTGGFSAGYFNTVGSKEGWTPSQFISSRSSRGEQKVARVEDFMDEEDLQELANTKRLVTTDEFDTLSEKELEKRRHQQLDEDAKRGTDLTFLTSSLMNLVAPTHDSTGMRLLRKMGWRPGQGVGPRTAFDDEAGGQQMTLAPKDTPIVDYQPKTNTFGLGYDLVANVPQVAEMRRFQQQQQDQQPTRSSSSGGFGLGVFDDDDDDMVLYDDQPGTAKYHHTLYDDPVSESRASKRKTTTSSDLAVKKARCSDGHPPLKGFHLSSQPQELGKWYPPPTVPASFDEMHTQQRSTGANKKRTTDQIVTIDARGAMLGEKPIEARSVFDYMSSKTKERLAQATSSMSEPPIDKTRLQVTLIPKDVAQLALRGFMPFGDTPEKQKRYKQFLESSLEQQQQNSKNNEPNNTITFDIPGGMTHESGMKELNEFTQAARIFRPISSMMSGRFTTSTGSTTPTNVEQVAFEGGLKTEAQWKKEKEIRENQVMDEPKPELSQEAEAAAMNMFGQMTRTQLPFYPNRLLCKRFNVRNPHPDHVPQGPGHRTQAGSTSALDEKAMMSMLTPQQQPTPVKKLELAETQQDDPALRAIIAKPSSRTETPTEEKDNKGEDDEKPLDYERPAMDIFKAIFETSDDESDTEVNTPTAPSDDKAIENKPKPMMSNQDDDNDFIGPPPPTAQPSPPPTNTDPLPFRPVFTKRASQDTKLHSEQVLVTPFEPRLSSSSSKKRSQRRRVSISSEASSAEESEDDRAKEKKRRRHSSSSSSKKKKKSSHSKKRKHHSSRHDSDSENEHDRNRHHRRKDDKEKKHHSSSKKKQEDDLELWVEKPSVPRRSRAEDLW